VTRSASNFEVLKNSAEEGEEEEGERSAKRKKKGGRAQRSEDEPHGDLDWSRECGRHINSAATR